MKNQIKTLLLSAGMLTLAACSDTVAPSEVDVYAGDPVDLQSVYTPEHSHDDMATSVEVPSFSGSSLSQMDLVKMDASTVWFGYDSSALSAHAQGALAKVAAAAAAAETTGLVVEGHADERGTREYNLALGDRRAVAVKKYLVSRGVNPAAITTISYGKERPAEMGHNESAWAKNRRAEIVVK